MINYLCEYLEDHYNTLYAYSKNTDSKYRNKCLNKLLKQNNYILNNLALRSLYGKNRQMGGNKLSDFVSDEKLKLDNAVTGIETAWKAQNIKNDDLIKNIKRLLGILTVLVKQAKEMADSSNIIVTSAATAAAAGKNKWTTFYDGNTSTAVTNSGPKLTKLLDDINKISVLITPKIKI